MIYAGQFFDVDVNRNSIMIPCGVRVLIFVLIKSFYDVAAPSPIFSKRFTGQIALGRNLGLSKRLKRFVHLYHS